MPTLGSVDKRAPVLVLALGNRLLKDDGIGAELLSRLERSGDLLGGDVELLDGGTRGLALLGELQDRAAVFVLDAVRLGAEPGTMHVLRKEELLGMNGRSSATAHEGGVKELLAALELLGETPRELTVIGIEPDEVETGMELSNRVEARMREAAICAKELIQCLGESNVPRDTR